MLLRILETMSAHPSPPLSRNIHFRLLKKFFSDSKFYYKTNKRLYKLKIKDDRNPHPALQSSPNNLEACKISPTRTVMIAERNASPQKWLLLNSRLSLEDKDVSQLVT